jgi:glycyl-tRNA synthetase beta chain
MARAAAADFLVEVGTEELPPRALKDLMHAFAEGLREGLARERLEHGRISPYASPRRLAVLVSRLATAQQDLERELRGPPVSVAFDEAGKATAAGRAFAQKCGVSVEALGRVSTGKGEWVTCRSVEAGRPAAELLPDLVNQALERLPIPRRMRWGGNDFEFVRPVHWLVMLHGTEIVPGSVLGIAAGRNTRGHRSLAPGDIAVPEPQAYPGLLEGEGFVVADFAERKRRIAAGVERAAAEAGGEPLADDALFEEVTALTEWPVALTGRFDDSYLTLPREVIAATLASHQRCFPVADAAGALLPRFVVVANLESRDPDKVRDGNERVIRPRLADAAFFWEHDRRTPLAARRAGLEAVVYQKGLGSVADRSARIARLAALYAGRLDLDAAVVERAAGLAKCDLLTGMVGEFPELQGVMGRYYAVESGESEAVAQAIGEQYLPRFAGDALPSTKAGQVLAVADRLDSLAGAFALGRKPSGNRDPFGLRRAALGVVRIAVEKALNLDLGDAIGAAVTEQPVADVDREATADSILAFLLERLRSYYADQGLATEVFEAVRAREPATLPDFDARVQAVASFVELDSAASLSAANKRIANILKQAGDEGCPSLAVDEGLLSEDAERRLRAALAAAREDLRPLIARRDYGAALSRLAELREPVDRFFDKVMVMTEDAALRRNRLALLADLRAMFLEVADVSRLALG